MNGWDRGTPLAVGWYFATVECGDVVVPEFYRYWDAGWSAPVHREDMDNAVITEAARAAVAENPGAIRWMRPAPAAGRVCECRKGAPCVASPDGFARGRVSIISDIRCRSAMRRGTEHAASIADLDMQDRHRASASVAATTNAPKSRARLVRRAVDPFAAVYASVRDAEPAPPTRSPYEAREAEWRAGYEARQAPPRTPEEQANCDRPVACAAAAAAPYAVYLSGPMTGYPENNFPAFHETAAKLRAKGLKVMSPAEVNTNGGDWNACLRADIKVLMDCAAVALMPGWENSKGAHLELHIAHALGMRVLFVADLLR